MAAEAMGINTRNVKLLAFAMGASFVSIGAIFSSFWGFVNSEDFYISSLLWFYVWSFWVEWDIFWSRSRGIYTCYLTGNLRGVAAPIQESIFGVVLIDPESLRMILFGLALILVMLYRPTGL